MERISVVAGEEGASSVGSFGEAQTPDVVGEMLLVGWSWSWWMKSWGMVTGLSFQMALGLYFVICLRPVQMEPELL